ncbi:type IV conjugative transfer system protein TraL [Succinivibrio dextrinosolvens]|uniref:type IV conjugative transfer system protein TraL n=1 Tax=Succinivibrio dextrinosolvens TaxID=83771 RepID=UPI00241D147E|nr:type IV conjugative transfer system protein TraL [Succinivibrio dextrinosolvens]MBE6423085.1 type IV conjugative transfer system protein TraL [Succinivibrio dextrinosolvens]
MSEKPIEIPQHQDDPQWIMIWPMDELLPIVFGFCFGLLIGQVLICSAVGLGIAKAYKFAKSSRHKGFVLHWLYGHGLLWTKNRTLKNTYNRKFIPR